MNTVNEDNFNETMKGYIIRAFKIANEENKYFSEEDIERFNNGLRWSIDEMTMEGARKEYLKKNNSIER